LRVALLTWRRKQNQFPTFHGFQNCDDSKK
jgi:hypothetical protein